MRMKANYYNFEDISMTVFTNNQNFTLAMEFNSESPIGEPFDGHWVLRDWNDQIVDYDLFLDQVIKRNDIELD